ISATVQAAVEAHVANCPTCSAALDDLSDNHDLRRLLPRAMAIKEQADDAAMRHLIAELESGRSREDDRGADDEIRWEAGTVLDEYRIEGEIGRGGMGVVLRASDESLGRTVAIKVLRSEGTDTKARARLIQEARIVAKLRHDNVVTVHAVVNRAGAAPYLVMEHVAGATLAALIRLRGRLEPGQAAEIVAQVALGLGAAHQHGLIHRDVKPSNVLVDSASGRAKISDFGLARGGDDAASMTQEGLLAGTPTYMSPEQARSGLRLDHRADIYGLGVTLYEALTGEVPFRGAPHMVFQQVTGEEPRPPRAWNDRVPRDLETICLKAMAKEPNRRYQTAGEFAEDLRRWLRGETIRARPAGRLERTGRWCRRRPLVAGLAAALLLVVAAGFASTFSQWRRAEVERKRAERQRDEAIEQRALAERNFRQAREAVDTYLTHVSDNDVLKAQNLEPLRRELLRTARDFYERFVQQAPDDQHLAAELGRAYKRLGLITSVLESWPKALGHFQKMRTIFERLHEAEPDNPLYQSELAESWFREGVCLRAGNTAMPPTVAEAALRRAQKLQEALVQAHPEEPAYQSDLARTLRSLGNLYLFLMNDHSRAEQALVTAQGICDALPRDHAQLPAIRLEHAVVLLSLAKLYSYTDRRELHRAAAATASASFESLVGAHVGNPDYLSYFIDALSELADAYRNLAQVDRAQTTWQRALGVAGDLVGSHPASGSYRHLVADIAYSLASLAYHEQHRGDLARPLLQKALEIEEELTANFPDVSEYGFYVSNLLRDFRDWYGDTAPLVAWRDRTNLTNSEQAKAARSAPEKRDGVRSAYYYSSLSYADSLLASSSEIADDWRAALA
ncbi:MAG: protein kinase domain-containing protein, partial [Isosphaeraceae bacterium]